LLGAGDAVPEVAGDIAVEGLEAREALGEAPFVGGFVGRGRTSAEPIFLLESVLGLEVAILRLLGGKTLRAPHNRGEAFGIDANGTSWSRLGAWWASRRCAVDIRSLNVGRRAGAQGNVDIVAIRA